MPFLHGSWTEFRQAAGLGRANESAVSRNFCTTHPIICATDLAAPAAIEPGAAGAGASRPAQDNRFDCKFCTRPVFRRMAAGSRQRLNRCNQAVGRGLQFLLEGVALFLRRGRVMKTYAHDIVQRLLELQSLEERLEQFQRSKEKTADVQALIESLRSNLPVSVLIDHDRMRKKGKASVAQVRHGVCSACHPRWRWAMWP